MRRRRALRAGPVLTGAFAAALVLGACTSSPGSTPTGTSSPMANLPTTSPAAALGSTPPSTPAAGASPTSVPTRPVLPTQPPPASPAVTARRTVDKVLVVVVENHSLSQMRAQMPYTYGLATRYGYAADYRAVTHPSLPNYLAIAGGSTFGVHDDRPPSAHPLQGPSVLGAAVRAGSTAKVYAESMTVPCQRTPQGPYAVKHNPWAYYVQETAPCRRYDVPLTALRADVAAGRLPAVGMVVPNLCDDAHDCSLARADAFMRRYVGAVLAGPDWHSGRLAVVITADEDDRHHGNRVLTVVAQPSLHGVVVRTRLNHYALSRSLAEVAGVPPLRHAATARSLLRAFGLTPA
ncbi:alkaline phosphatase family protein [Cellulomonas alba]|uniref:Alkaline phosphatase family protein n=1 Tax=Cellulomonas alba TaxID=3053467 RepID=A0ABT7SJC4_9CELL|nr:alkaline phosphatase family protein [Cellulomonas alba]MDM7856287.1 alkaline phosphatase family protein [Cellulomonas alba]